MKDSNMCQKCGEIHPKCAAHRKLKNSPDGEYHPCGQKPMENGNCRLHGGKTPRGVFSPHYKHGKRSKYLNELKGKRKKLLESCVIPPNKLPNILDNIELEEMRMHELLQMLDNSTMIERWIELQARFSGLLALIFNPPEITTDENFRDPEDILKEKIEAQAKAIAGIFAKFAGNERLFEKIQDSNERIRRFQETNAKLRAANIEELMKTQKLVPVERFTLFTEMVAKILHQSPMEIRQRQINDLREEFMKLPELIREPYLLT